MIELTTFVVILRDPTDRLFSEFNHHKNRKRFGNMTFVQYVDKMETLWNKCQLLHPLNYSVCYQIPMVPMRHNPLVSGMIHSQLQMWLDAGIPVSSFLLVSMKDYVSSVNGRKAVLRKIFEKSGIKGNNDQFDNYLKKIQTPIKAMNAQTRNRDMGDLMRTRLKNFYSSHKKRTQDLILNQNFQLIPNFSHEEILNGTFW